MYNQTIDCNQKVDMIQQKFEQEKKRMMTKFKDAIESKGVTDEPTQEGFVSEDNE